MKVAAGAEMGDLEAAVAPNFGRSPFFLVVELDTMSYEVVPNEAAAASGGAGFQAAQTVAALGVQAVLTGMIGPNAFAALQANGISVFSVPGGTVRSAVQAYRAAHLSPLAGPNVGSYAPVSRLGPGPGRGDKRRPGNAWGATPPGGRTGRKEDHRGTEHTERTRGRAASP